jgi:hypothetical protein
MNDGNGDAKREEEVADRGVEEGVRMRTMVRVVLGGGGGNGCNERRVVVVCGDDNMGKDEVV